ncbi:hypothetical protein SDC9_174511 [bioreactor metagenome]|uniref:Uncharacterized protein n=1 Tax=bioreactor metagenome TaxID=1076179 RepID=A0A645GSV1_9ZZZZ
MGKGQVDFIHGGTQGAIFFNGMQQKTLHRFFQPIQKALRQRQADPAQISSQPRQVIRYGLIGCGGVHRIHAGENARHQGAVSDITGEYAHLIQGAAERRDAVT